MAEADPTRNEEIAVERRDVPLALVAALAAGLTLFVAAAVLCIRIAYPSALSGPSDAPRLLTAQPRLQIDPAADLAALRAAQQRILAGYGWVDRGRGVARIPIGQAMRDIAADGIADWPKYGR